MNGDNAAAWIVGVWVAWITLLAFMTLSQPGALEQVATIARLGSASLGPNAMSDIITGAFGLLGTIAAGYFTVQLRKIDSRGKKIDEAVNTRHHYRLDAKGDPVSDENGQPVKLNLVDYAKDTHDAVIVVQHEVAEAKRLAVENRDQLDDIVEWQHRHETKPPTCQFHEDNVALLSKLRNDLENTKED